eukprot:9142036-Pyramimonas_sp.AAC.1
MNEIISDGPHALTTAIDPNDAIAHVEDTRAHMREPVSDNVIGIPPGVHFLVARRSPCSRRGQGSDGRAILLQK